MPQEPCCFCRIEYVHEQSKTMMADGSPAPPKVKEQAWCGHPRAEHYRNTVRPDAPCGGNLEKCAVPLTAFRRF
jgi:hypothetical protein